MCGICGIAYSSKSGRRVDTDTLTEMRDIIKYRGPDDEGLYVDGAIGLGHRRLSIVDVASGHQPMTNEDGSVHITYNGEIYNHADFRSSLEAKGHIYRTYCDTETIIHLYEEYGERCVDFLRGMFAFAIWDERQQQLFIARDRLGVKPLYYTQTADGSLFFGSEIKTLFRAGAIKPALNYEALPDYLANHSTSGESTLFEGVKRLLPGHTLLWRDGQLNINRYWDVSFTKDDANGLSDAQYIEQWADLFRTSVKLRLMADVPLGMFLSGGIDSSAIAAVMSGMVDDPIKTFSVAFHEREANELEYARLVAEQYKTDHHEVVVSAGDFFSVLPKLIWHEDEPLAHPSSVALYFVSRLASEHVKVVLTGEGSDELLAGYAKYRKTLLNLSWGTRYHKATPELIKSTVRKQLAGLPGGRLKQKLLRTFLTLTPDIETIYFDNFAVFSRDAQSQLLSSETRERIITSNPYQAVSELLSRTDATSLLDRLLYADIKTYLHELLMKQDQMSMATSLESRVPFLDHKLVEFTAGLPERLKLRGWTTKYVLRQSMKKILPEAILSRSKMGFPVPIASWFRSDYSSVIDEYVLSDRVLSRGLFDPNYLKDIVRRHQTGGENHDERLWALVNFEMWQRQFLDGEDLNVSEPEVETVHAAM